MKQNEFKEGEGVALFFYTTLGLYKRMSFFTRRLSAFTKKKEKKKQVLFFIRGRSMSSRYVLIRLSFFYRT